VPSEPKRVSLAIDIVLHALIASESESVDSLISKAAAGHVELCVSDLAIYCAFASLRDTDKINFARFANLLQYATIESSRARHPNGFSKPSPEAIEHWRRVALQPN